MTNRPPPPKGRSSPALASRRPHPTEWGAGDPRPSPAPLALNRPRAGPTTPARIRISHPMSTGPTVLDQTPTNPRADAQDARLLISLATFNEVENLRPLVEEIRRHAPRAAVLVIDDNS